MIYKKDSLTSCLWEGTLYDMLKSAIRGHWDKNILDKSRASAHTGVAIRIQSGHATCTSRRTDCHVAALLAMTYDIWGVDYVSGRIM